MKGHVYVGDKPSFLRRSDCVKVIEEARKELLAALDGLTDEVINRKPADDKWSIKQILEHLYLFEIGVVQKVKDQLATGEEGRVKDKPIHLAINRAIKVEAPNNVKPSETFATLDELKRHLVSSRKKLIELVNEADDEALEQKALPHPGFNMLSLKQWIEFIGWHERRHILQIQEVKEEM